MIKPVEEYSEMISRLFPEDKRRVKTVTLQITDSYNLQCTYCYQHNKGEHFLEFETAKKFIDILLKGDNPYINKENTSGIILEFIGGEPFLAIDLIDKITEYTLNKMIQENHPWLYRFRISICSNGILYFDKKVQDYLNKYKNFISFTISIDGNKELHDKCRVFPDGSGSYDKAVTAAQHFMKNFYRLSTKMTLAPENIEYTAAALKNLIDLGYTQIFCNCVYEEG